MLQALEVSPTDPFLNLKVSGDKAVRLTMKRSQPKFEVQSCACSRVPSRLAINKTVAPP